MTDKDPKDMTVSELMRVAANRVEMEGNSQDAINCLRMTVGVDDEITYPKDLAKTLSVLADKIDAELAQARRSGLERAAKSWAKANGWPDFRDGEDFGAWLRRCALKRPVFDDGEPMQIGNLVSSKLFGNVSVGAIEYTATDVFVKDAPDGDWSTSILVDKPLKRPAPEVLGADGKPVKVGETVYPIDGEWLGIPLEVSGIESPASVKVYLSAGKSWTTFHADRLTHTPPDTQEKIDADKNLMWTIYWDCTKRDCLGCDVLHGKSPSEYYNVHNCSVAQGLDIARRQAELDKRAGGAE